MPTYEYKCPNCKITVTLFCKVKDRNNQKCFKCSAILKKLVSSAGIRFIGPGFYRNDYKRAAEIEKDHTLDPKTIRRKEDG